MFKLTEEIPTRLTKYSDNKRYWSASKLGSVTETNFRIYQIFVTYFLGLEKQKRHINTILRGCGPSDLPWVSFIQTVSRTGPVPPMRTVSDSASVFRIPNKRCENR